jgi:hypothetical protein
MIAQVSTTGPTYGHKKSFGCRVMAISLALNIVGVDGLITAKLSVDLTPGTGPAGGRRAQAKAGRKIIPGLTVYT